jgi:hypothetical protein
MSMERSVLSLLSIWVMYGHLKKKLTNIKLKSEFKTKFNIRRRMSILVAFE